MTTTIDPAEADRALKDKHRAMWALGDYPAVADEVIPDLGGVLVEAAGVRAGQRVLDVAAGSGNAAIPAAVRGAHVVASDLTRELLRRGREVADSAGISIAWREADAEAMPFPDGAFDVVMSCVGVMFAPHHDASAAELLRVCRPGGTIALVSWTPEGFIGEMFATMKPYVAPPPPGAKPPLLWGSEDYLAHLFGDAVQFLSVRRELAPVDRFANGAEFRDFFKANYGPTVAAYRGLAGDAARTAALDHDLAELGRRHDLGGGRMAWEYLLVVAHKRG